MTTSRRTSSSLLAGLALITASTSLALLCADPGRAQSQRFLLGPGSSVGPSTKVKPENCVTAEDGSITCDTKLENSPSDTPARPQMDPFPN
ncbi:hypothetical protein VB716_08380 [Synechococcus sp. CCY9201]|uniref:hypothetical protein n=1 Tax=unclassified Synechococcus TaxID=2626047 RepID=UPI001E4B858A|nr:MULTISPECIES: hypothetical protein [unclassified Synechococcus]MEA5474237.1 hypothetical protein [Synechococcus sp. CCY9201]CAK6693359.1 hypothetical protein IFHNHDMJ_01406 [Synechococcus sp. CBW1107]